MAAPSRRSRPYLFWDQSTLLCETCLGLVRQRSNRDNQVWYEKRCREHGQVTGADLDRLPRIGNTARTISSRAIARCRCKVLQNRGALMIAACAPDTSRTLAILDAVRVRPMRHLTININGVCGSRSSRGSRSTRAGVKSICGSIR
jgi:hypothetical protein